MATRQQSDAVRLPGVFPPHGHPRGDPPRGRGGSAPPRPARPAPRPEAAGSARLGILLPGAVAAAGTWGLFLVHQRLLGPTPPTDQLSGFFNLPALRFKLFESGPIPFAVTWAFLLGLVYLFLIERRVLRPLRASLKDDLPLVQAARDGNLNAMLAFLYVNATSARRGYYHDRFDRLRQRLDADQDLSTVLAVKDDILKSDEENFVLAFAPVSWIEWLLPLLGFLGTVVGIGEAIGAVNGGVQTLFASRQLTQDALGDFNAGFRGLGVAFDTTFQGLAGLIVIGGIHFLLKRRLAEHLATAGTLLSDTVSRWKGRSGAVVMAVEGLSGHTRGVAERVEALGRRMDALQESVRRSDERATEFRETVRGMVERVILEDPQFASIRRVLCTPLVQFAAFGWNLGVQVKRRITRALGHAEWQLACLGLSATAPGVAVAAVRGTGRGDHLIVFEVEGEPEPAARARTAEGDDAGRREPSTSTPPSGARDDEDRDEAASDAEDREVVDREDVEWQDRDAGDPDREGSADAEDAEDAEEDDGRGLIETPHRWMSLWLMDAGETVLGRSEDGRLIAWRAADPRPQRVLLDGLDADEPVLVVRVRERAAAIVARRHGAAFALVALQADPGEPAVELGELPADCDWSVWTADAASGTIAAAGLAGRRPHLLVARVSPAPPPPPAPPDEGDEAAARGGGGDGALELEVQLRAELPSRLLPRQLLALGPSVLLLLDRDGRLHYWDATRPAPLRLEHPDWPVDPRAVIRAGGHGWFALVADGRLGMWQVRRGGVLSPYEGETLAASGLRPETLHATADGRYLLGIAGDVPVGWEFPRYVADAL